MGYRYRLLLLSEIEIRETMDCGRARLNQGTGDRCPEMTVIIEYTCALWCPSHFVCLYVSLTIKARWTSLLVLLLKEDRKMYDHRVPANKQLLVWSTYGHAFVAQERAIKDNNGLLVSTIIEKIIGRLFDLCCHCCCPSAGGLRRLFDHCPLRRRLQISFINTCCASV